MKYLGHSLYDWAAKYVWLKWLNHIINSLLPRTMFIGEEQLYKYEIKHWYASKVVFASNLIIILRATTAT